MAVPTLEVVTEPETPAQVARGSHRARYTIDIDTGGTFTDGFIADHETGRVVLSKVPSTPHDPSQSLLDCTAFAAAELGIQQRDLLQDFATIHARLLLHSTLIPFSPATAWSTARAVMAM